MPTSLRRRPTAPARRAAALLLLLAAAAACDGDRATAPATRPAGPSADIVDGAHSAAATSSHFYFLPPTVLSPSRPAFAGTFDPTVVAVARVCAGTGVCRPANALASFAPGGGTGGGPLAALRESDALQAYAAVWDTRRCATGPCALVPGGAYRLHVYATNARGIDVELGSADVAVVAPPARGRPLPAVDPDAYSPLVVGLPYVVAFRVERGVVGAVSVSGATSPFKVGATQTLAATVQDLHGATLAGPAVTWRSSDASVATVDAAGVVTAVGPGSADVTATADLQSGTTTVTVIPASLNAWTARAPMHAPRFGFATGVLGGLLYAAGGSVNAPNNAFLASVEAYDPAADAWSARAPLSVPRYAAAAGAVNGRLYVVGGLTPGAAGTTILGTVEAYDPATNAWSARAPLHTPRYGATAGVVNGVLYVAGGYSNGAFLSSVEAYDPAADAWTVVAPMGAARYGATAGVINGTLFVAGGSGGPTTASSLESYDPAANAWTPRAPLLAPRSAAAAGVVGGLLYVVGGFSNGAFRATVDAYDPATDSWSAKAPMSTLRYFPGAGVVNGALYVAGGEDINAVLASAEQYLP